jgi:protein-S-isoprenylcysteine O-methyltransferase Ste14
LTPADMPEKINRRLLLLSLLLTPPFFLLLIFLPAGNLLWDKGWLFVVVILVTGMVCTVYLCRVNPDVVIARSSPHQGTKRWDRPIIVLICLTLSAISPVAALDERFHWFLLPWWVTILGYVLLVLGIGIMTWAQAVNKFFETTVRIQTDRDQKVIETGPYAFVRHPGYISCFPLSAGIALSLGSLWALIPASLSCLVLIVRTRWEDQTLQAELAGYKEYTQRVRYRLLPGVW